MISTSTVTLLALGLVFTDGRLGVEGTDGTDDVEQNGEEMTGVGEPRSETDKLSLNMVRRRRLRVVVAACAAGVVDGVGVEIGDEEVVCRTD
ncbi:hypothetical protein ACFX2I_022983 [Malus domestica]